MLGNYHKRYESGESGRQLEQHSQPPAGANRNNNNP